MPMPQTYSPCPRPILKRSAAIPVNHDVAPKDESNHLLSIDPSILSPMVRFPPTTSIARTFAAYPPSAYDRSPIVVSPNRCSLPERGCPGKTYLPGESPRSSSHRAQRTSTQNGKCLHPRAVPPSHPSSNPSYAFDDEDEDDNDLTPKPTPTLYSRPLPQAQYPPALVPDISSSESEESDGFAGHYSSSSELSLPDMTNPYLIPKHPSFLPHPHQQSRSRVPLTAPSIPIAPSGRHSTSPARSSSPNSRRRHASPSRPRRSRGSSRPGDVVVPPLEPRYKTFSESSMLTSCALSVPDMGCLGGF